MSHNAKLILLDEATAGLDPVARDEVLNILCDFARDESHSVLISSHIVSDLEKICDYIAFLHKGKLMVCEEKDTLREMYGLLRCTEELADELSPEAFIGRRESPYGVEALVLRSRIPEGMDVKPVDIEQMFIFMAKEGKAV